MHRENLHRGLDFQDQRLLDHHVDDEIGIDPTTFINDRQADVAKKDDASEVEFVAQTGFIHAYQQLRAVGSIHFTAQPMTHQVRSGSYWNSLCLCAFVVKFIKAEVKDS